MALEANVKQYTTEMEKARRETDALGKDVADLDRKLGQVREGAGIGIAAGTAIGLGVATKAASDLREAQAAANVVFGEGSDVITKYAEDAAQAIGLSKKEALDATTVFGTMFSQIGLGNEQSVQLSTSLVDLAADLGSLKNVDPTQIIESMSSAFRGEYDSLQKYIPTLTDAAIKQEALTQTGKKNADSLTLQEKALATYTLMMRDAGPAMGDFARSNGSAATEAKKAAAESKNAAASIGEALLPVTAKAAEAVGFLANQFGRLPGPVQTGVIGLGGMSLAAGLLLPKLVETAQILKLGTSRAMEFGRAATLPTSGLGKFAGALGLAATALAAYSTTYSALEAATSSNTDFKGLAKDLQLIADGASELDPVFQSAGGTAEGMAQKVRDLLGSMDEGKAERFGDVLLSFQNADPGAMWSDFSEAIGEGIGRQAQQDIEDLDTALADFAAGSPAEAKKVFGDMVNALIEQGLTVEQISGLFPQYRDEIIRSEKANKGAAGAAGDHAGAQGDLAAEAQKAADALREQVDAATASFEAQRGVTDAEEEYVGAVMAVDDARRGVADAEAEVASAKEGVAAAVRAERDANEAVADAYGAVDSARRGVADAEREVVDAQREAAATADAIRVATEELAVARKAATGDSDEYRDAMQGVYDAEVDLAQAQEDSLTAQQNLDQARQDYSKTLAGLQRDAEGAADGVIGAEIRLRDAQESLATLGDSAQRRVDDASARLSNLDATASAEERARAERDLADAIAAMPDADDRARAELAVRDAQRGVAEATERASDAAAEAARVEAAGAEGSDAVVAARQGVIDATTNEVDAQRNLEGAVQTVADVQTTAIGNVATAQGNLETAILDRAAADQRVIDAKQGVVEAQDGVASAVRGVRDAQERARDATNGVADANQRVIDAKAAVVDAQGAVATAIDGVRDSVLKLALAQFEAGTKTGITKDEIDKQILRLGALRDTLDPANPLRRQLDEYIARLQATNGQFTAVIALNFTDAAGAVVENGQAIVAAALGPKSAGKLGKAAGSDGLTIGTGPGPWTNPYGPVPYKFNKLGSAPVGTTAPMAPAASPFQIMGPLAPSWAQCGGGTSAFNAKDVARELAAALPHQGPLVHVERVEEGVGLAAVFQQAEFASRAA